MKKNLELKVVDLDGKEMMDVDGKTPIVMRVLIARGLAMPAESDRDLPAEKKAARGALAVRVYKDVAGEEDYKPEEIAQMKEYVAKSYGPLAITQIFAHLDE